MRWLEPALAERLRRETPEVRVRVEELAAPHAAIRFGALDGILRGEDAEEDPLALLPYVLGLATARGYPQAATLLTRVAQLVRAIDSPPRALAKGGGDARAQALYEAIGEHGLRLVDLARRSSDPTVARLAAALAARFPALDGALEPVLLALASGAPDPDEAAPLLYAFARVQLARGAALHRRLAEGLAKPASDPRGLAVALAILDGGDPPPHEAERLRERVNAAPTAALDPRAFGRRLGAYEDTPKPD